MAQADAATVMAIETRLGARLAHTRGTTRSLPAQEPLYPRKAERFQSAFRLERVLVRRRLPAFTELNVSQPKFFGALNEALTTTSLANWKAYFRWHLVHAYAPYLSPAFETSNFDFYSAYLRGLKAPPPRWKKCTRLVDRQLGEALGEVFVARTFTPPPSRPL